MALSTTIKAIQDIMRKDAGLDGDAQRISQLVWMIFLKVFDDLEAQKELLDDDYKSPIPQKLRWRAWAKDAEGLTGDQLLDFINNELFRKLKELPATGKSAALAGVVRGVFEDAFNYMKSGTLLRQVVNKLEEIDFNRASDRHEFGDVYEKLLSDLQNAGRGRVLHAACGHAVHRRPGRPEARRDDPRPGVWDGRLPHVRDRARARQVREEREGRGKAPGKHQRR